MSHDKYVITVSRQFGSRGRLIAKEMAEILGIDYYDRDLVEQAAQQLNLPAAVVDRTEETARRISPNLFSWMAYPMDSSITGVQEQIFRAQKDFIRSLSGQEPFVIVGRCSDYILSDIKDSMHLYIYAPFEIRVQNCMKDLHLDIDRARKTILSMDEARDSYYMNIAGYLPDDKRHKDLMIDSSLLGIHGTSEYLAEAVRRRFQSKGERLWKKD